MAGGVAAAVSLIVNWALRDPHEPEPSTSRPSRDPFTGQSSRRSNKPQCVKIGLMVWRRLSKQEANELICTLLGRDPRRVLQGRSTERQVRAIVKLVWHRASLQEASEMIRALDKLPETPRKAMRKLLSDDDDPDDPLFPRRHRAP